MNTHRLLRKAFRKRLLPHVEQCLLGKAIPQAQHHTRRELDKQTASEILACLEGEHSRFNNHTVPDLLDMWQNFKEVEQADFLSIGNFCSHLYELQMIHDMRLHETAAGTDAEPKPSLIEQQERRMHTMATLYIAGFVPRFETEELLC